MFNSSQELQFDNSLLIILEWFINLNLSKVCMVQLEQSHLRNIRDTRKTNKFISYKMSILFNNKNVYKNNFSLYI